MTNQAKAERALLKAQDAYRAVEAKACVAADPRAPEILAAEQEALAEIHRASKALEAAKKAKR